MKAFLRNPFRRTVEGNNGRGPFTLTTLVVLPLIVVTVALIGYLALGRRVFEGADPSIERLPSRHGKGPENTWMIGNRDCPVSGDRVDPDYHVGMAYNGWWIRLCCPDCEDDFLADVDRYAEVLLERDGCVDVRQPPAPGGHHSQ